MTWKYIHKDDQFGINTEEYQIHIHTSDIFNGNACKQITWLSPQHQQLTFLNVNIHGSPTNDEFDEQSSININLRNGIYHETCCLQCPVHL